jgi:hypothetical protein
VTIAGAQSAQAGAPQAAHGAGAAQPQLDGQGSQQSPDRILAASAAAAAPANSARAKLGLFSRFHMGTSSTPKSNRDSESATNLPSPAFNDRVAGSVEKPAFLPRLPSLQRCGCHP